MVALWISCPNKENAELITKELVRSKLIYFGQIFPVDSFYLQNREMIPDHQYVIFGELDEVNLKKAESEILQLHGDKIPCWSVIPIQSISEASQKWIKDNKK
jgi:uncharacterized protein involved in tolerance to divalent cations